MSGARPMTGLEINKAFAGLLDKLDAFSEGMCSLKADLALLKSDVTEMRTNGLETKGKRAERDEGIDRKIAGIEKAIRGMTRDAMPKTWARTRLANGKRTRG